ncbi:hypothetical protein [Marinobacterium litorale]|uniref:hypothetical protein n=1 Tax=Marinobacterium litorale TaxID=404770 RepID=UPI000420BCB4|nr:hypothetical protein [Marinobacterium litorale]
MPLPSTTAAIFRFPHNWSSSVTESREYKTDVMRSRDGTEQRRAMRSKPRKSLSFDVLLDGNDATALDYMLYALQPHVWLLPQWHRQRRLASSAATGTDILVLDQPVAYDAQAGDYLVLMRTGQEPEAQTIAAIAGDRVTITLVDTLEADWSTYSAVYPAVPAQINGAASGKRLTSGVLRLPLSFSYIVDSRPPVSSTLTADDTIGDLEVLVRPINWVNSPEAGYAWVPMMIDAQIGPTAYETDGDLPPNTRKGEVTTETRAETDWWLAFFDRCRGRQRPFLMPTWWDINLQDPLTAGATFEVPGTELGTYLTGDPIHTHLMVRKRDRSLAFFEITALTANVNDGVTVITTTEAWAEAYEPWECVQACLVSVCRLASDRLEIEWITDEVAKFAIAIQIVEDVA